MKKKIIFAILVMASCMSANIAYAQIEVKTNGRVEIGEDQCQLTIPPSMADSITMLKIFGTGTNNSKGRLSFGDQWYWGALNCMVGESGNADTDKLWLHGRKGLCATFGVQSEDTVFNYNYLADILEVHVPISAPAVYTTSDRRFKDDIKPVDDALSAINSLTGVSYRLKSDNQAWEKFNEAMQQIDPADEKYQKDREIFERLYANRAKGDVHYGFIAQDVQRVLPDLVHEDPNGYLCVDYISVIPLLVNAIQELQGELAELKGEDAMLAPAVKRQGNDAMITERTATVLGQNDPNPFTSDTNIGVCLPDDVAQAAIYIYDLQGKQVRRLDVPERGQTTVTLHGGDLPAGMYIYSLIADGKELASKKMILTK